MTRSYLAPQARRLAARRPRSHRGAFAKADSWREAQQTAAQVSDRVLAGSILAIAERVIVTEDGSSKSTSPMSRSRC